MRIRRSGGRAQIVRRWDVPEVARGLPKLELEVTSRMSQKTVQLIIGRLVTDEELRLRFVDHPYETLVHLREQGFELTADEIEALAESDARMWVSVAKRINPRLQGCSLRNRNW